MTDWQLLAFGAGFTALASTVVGVIVGVVTFLTQRAIAREDRLEARLHQGLDSLWNVLAYISTRIKPTDSDEVLEFDQKVYALFTPARSKLPYRETEDFSVGLHEFLAATDQDTRIRRLKRLKELEDMIRKKVHARVES